MKIRDEKSLGRYARLGGFMYLFVLGTYIIADFVMGGFPVKGDFAQVAASIQADELYYRSIHECFLNRAKAPMLTRRKSIGSGRLIIFS